MALLRMELAEVLVVRDRNSEEVGRLPKAGGLGGSVTPPEKNLVKWGEGVGAV